MSDSFSEKVNSITLYPPENCSDECIVPVCIGQDVKDSGILYYTAAAGKIFRKCHLIIGDTLDAYNISERNGKLWHDAVDVSRACGDRWIVKYFKNIDRFFNGNVTITRWDELKEDSLFEIRHNIIVEMYKNNNFVKNYVNFICQRYVDISCQRTYDKGYVADREKLLTRSVAYMLEELAGAVTYSSLFDAPTIFPDEYFPDPKFLNNHNNIDKSVDLTVSAWCRVSFGKHLKKIAA